MRVCRCGAKQDNRPARQNRLGKKVIAEVIPEVVAYPAARIRFYLHKEFRAAEIGLSLHKESRAAESGFYLLSTQTFRAAEIRISSTQTQTFAL